MPRSQVADVYRGAARGNGGGSLNKLVHHHAAGQFAARSEHSATFNRASRVLNIGDSIVDTCMT
jgi:hypothetical protein